MIYPLVPPGRRASEEKGEEREEGKEGKEREEEEQGMISAFSLPRRPSFCLHLLGYVYINSFLIIAVDATVKSVC